MKLLLKEILPTEYIDNVIKLKRVLEKNGFRVLKTGYKGDGAEFKIRAIDGKYFKLLLKQYK